MSNIEETFSCFVNLADVDYPEDIDLGLIGCYVSHNSDLLDVLVLSDSDQKLKIKKIKDNDYLRFEVKLLGTKQKFLGSVSFIAEKLKDIEPGESWSQLLPLFRTNGEDNDESDEYQRPFGEVKVVPPWVLLTFQPVEFTQVTAVSTSQTITKTKVTRGSKTKTSSSVKRESKGNQKSNRGSKANNRSSKKKEQTLEEKVLEIENELSSDMKELQTDDVEKVEHLDILHKNHNNLVPISEVDAKKNEEAQKYLNDLLQGINDMKAQDENDIQELVEIKGQLNEDIDAATNDLDILRKDKPDHIYGPSVNTTKGRHKAISNFLLNTLNQRSDNNGPILDENQVLRGKVNVLRKKVRAKLLSNEKEETTDDEINDLVKEYESLLDQHWEVFKQLDEEADANVNEFEKHGELWKQLFTQGMDLEK